MPGGLADSALGWKQAEGPAVAYRTRKLAIAAGSAAALARMWGHVTAGTLAADELVTVGAVSIGTANAAAAALTDLYLAHILQTGLLGLTAPADGPRLQLAVATAASDVGTNPADALDRLGRAEPLSTAQSVLHEGMRRRDVGGWTRVTGGRPCEVCAGLADGTVLPADVEMYSHPGCSCTAEPVSD